MEQYEPWPYHPQQRNTEVKMSDGIMDGQRAYERVQKKRIAASAPELLEALEMVIDYYTPEWNEYSGEDEANQPEWLQKARAAIAKARGQ